jgi:D-erythrulose 1-phosphate 3-epimerase
VTAYRLGINTCFAVKRWPEPERWAGIVAADLGLDLVQHSLDLVDLDAPAADVTDQAERLRAACAGRGLELDSTFTGLAAYSSNLLLHPDHAARERAKYWYRRVMDFTAACGATSTGGHIGAYSVADWHRSERRALLWDELTESLAELTAYARGCGLSALMAENLAAAREPSTLEMFATLLTDRDSLHAPVVACLDVGHMCVPGTSGDDRDPYAWLRRLGARAPIVQLQQADGLADHHWPFTAAHNAGGVIDAERVLTALDESGAEQVQLIIEVIPPFEQDDGTVIGELRESCDYWRAALATHGAG